MAVAYRSSSRTGQSDAYVSSINVPVPTGAAAGDIALVSVSRWESTNPAITAPSGFTEITQVVSGPDKIAIYWKRLTGADSGNYTFSWSGSQWALGQAMLATGVVASGDPIDAYHGVAASGAAYPATSVVATDADFLALFVRNATSGAGSPPASFTEVQDADYIKTNYRIPGAAGTYSGSGGTLPSGMCLGVLVALKPAGGGGSTTPVSVSGGITPSGAVARGSAKALGGATTPAGVVARQPRKTLGGAVTPTAVVLRAVLKVLGGTIAPSGAVATVRARVLALAGAIVPSGGLARATSKRTVGAVTPSGAVSKLVARLLGGSVTPSGAVGMIRTRLLALAGAIAPSGVLLRQPQKPLAGGATPSGAVTRSLARRLTGAVTPTGALASIRSRLIALAGSITPSGALRKTPGKTLAGSTAPAGVVGKRIGRLLAGGTVPAGAALKVLGRVLGGGITPVGGASAQFVEPVVATRAFMRAAFRRGPTASTKARPAATARGADRDGPTMRKG